MYTPDDITAGEMWACQFRTTRMLTENGEPVNPRNIRPGDTARGPGEYVGLGVIVKRDSGNRRLEVIDVADQTRHVVDYGDVFDIDRAEVIDD